MRKYQGKTNNTGVGFQPLGVRNVLEERQKKKKSADADLTWFSPRESQKKDGRR